MVAGVNIGTIQSPDNIGRRVAPHIAGQSDGGSATAHCPAVAVQGDSLRWEVLLSRRDIPCGAIPAKAVVGPREGAWFEGGTGVPRGG